MKKVSQDYLEATAWRAHRLIEIDYARNRAVLTINGEQFYADLPPVTEDGAS